MAREDYVKTDFMGYPYNGKYPPGGEKKGLYHGYGSATEETLFYDFAVQGYDLTFMYKGEHYYFLSTPEYVAQCDEHYTEEYQRFDDGNTALEQFKIEGRSLIELMNELEEVEPV